ncbi:succinyl-CoA synthetase beta subunit [Fonticula alba]|uniref:Succinyl-CoA synthetase beta subunit n=1 Tax=Fonticula alba TaxID=691883 RepID=A0A058YZW7_FONAL|nr:succinyl-CoA synthetase beta subunit [Fonticula alba]KCV67534.1 succinyl-CoA synthetase beta subunit [Fonticula alba]|eukprot:XP_009498095.1 succinyl-CoA synthetase beta subunit [Fonticula alba]
MFSVSKLSRDAMPLMRQAYLRISPTVMPVRHLNLHEYQSKDLMNEYGINTQKFKLVTSADGAADVASSLNVPEYVIKAQVHAGGRGKGTLSSGLKGGVHLTRDPKVAEDLTRQMLGYNIFTQQTPPEGVTVKSVMIAQALDIAHESYFAILMDRGFGGPVLVASPQGGMDIEAVAEETPELIYKQAVDISKGLAPADVMDLVEKMGFTDDKSKAEAADQIARLYKLFIDVDATQVEINPFGKDTDGNVIEIRCHLAH